MCYTKIQIQETSSIPPSANSGFVQSQIFHKCWPCHMPYWLAQWQILPFCFRPYQRIWPIQLVFFLTSTASFFLLVSVPGFPPLNGILSSEVLLPNGTLWVFSIYILVHIGFPQTTYPSFPGFSYVFPILLVLTYSHTLHLFSFPCTVLDPQHLYLVWIQPQNICCFFHTDFFFLCSLAKTHLFDGPCFFTWLSNQISAFFPLQITSFSVPTHSTWILVADEICK